MSGRWWWAIVVMPRWRVCVGWWGGRLYVSEGVIVLRIVAVHVWIQIVHRRSVIVIERESATL